MNTELSKGKKMTEWILAGLLTTLYLFSASGKFMIPKMASNFENWGNENRRVIIALGEITSALLFLFPKTNRYGSLLLSAYMGGVIMVHISHGTFIVMPAVVLVFVRINTYIHNQEFFKAK